MQTSKLVKVLAVVGGLLILAVLWFTIARPIVVLPRQRLSPGYLLVDKSGKSFSSDQQRGKLTLYSFAYTSCGERCTNLYQLLNELAGKIEAKGLTQPPLGFITISVDWQHETPQTLSVFQYSLQTASIPWVWLTGEEKRITNVVGTGFDVAFQVQPDGSIFLDPILVLVDGEGIIRSNFDLGATNADQLVYYIDLLHKEIAQTTGAGKIAYEAAHFFACYPH
jgi:protein SCO1/2